MKYFIKEITHKLRNYLENCGWGNGYVCIPEGHPLHGKEEIDIHIAMPSLEVHGGLTLSVGAKEHFQRLGEPLKCCENDWVVGFDTCHLGDNLEDWPKEKVEAETIRLKEQLEQLPIIYKKRMNRGQVEKAERLALNEFDKWNDISGFVEENTGHYYEFQDIIKDSVHIGIQMSINGKVKYGEDGNIERF